MPSRAVRMVGVEASMPSAAHSASSLIGTSPTGNSVCTLRRWRIGPMPERPATSDSSTSRLLHPTAETIPAPVIHIGSFIAVPISCGSRRYTGP